MDQQDGVDVIVGALQSAFPPSGIAYVFLNQGGDVGGSHSTRFVFNAAADDSLGGLGQPTGSMAIGSFNDDSYPDVAWCATSGGVRILLNWQPQDPNEVFHSSGLSTYAVAGSARALTVCDWDQNGLDDVLTGHSPTNPPGPGPFGISLLINLTDTGGAFEGFERRNHQAAFNDFLAYHEEVRVACTEVDRNGCPDVVVYGGDNDVSYFGVVKGQCNNDLRVQYAYGTLSRTTRDVKCGELGGQTGPNGEELLDIVVGNAADDRNVQVFQQQWAGGDAERVFEDAQHVPGTGQFAGPVRAITVSDFDQQAFGDQFYDDVAVCLGNLDVVRVYYADGTGLLDETDVFASSSFGDDLQAIDAGDIDNTNGPDIVVTDSSSGSQDDVYVLYNDGAGGFSLTGPITMDDGSENAANQPTGVVVADFNADGWVDAATANFASHTVTILMNDGGSLANDITIYPLADGAGPTAIAAGRINGDGFLDLVTANRLDRTVTVLFTDSSGTVVSTSTYAAGAEPIGVVVQDLSSDCYDDVIVLNASDGTGPVEAISVLLNDPESPGTFHDDHRYVMPAGPDPVAITGCDLDNNGKNDIANIGGHFGHIRITWNRCLCELRGDMNADCILCGLDIQPFVDCYILGETGACANCSRADMDEDGDLDIDDVECFVNALLNLESCVDPCPFGLQPGSGGEADFGQSALLAESSESSTSADLELLEAVQDVLDWMDENPYSPDSMTMEQYIESLSNVMIGAGLLPADEEDAP